MAKLTGTMLALVVVVSAANVRAKDGPSTVVWRRRSCLLRWKSDRTRSISTLRSPRAIAIHAVITTAV
jgi:hypothetical protein